MTLRSTVAAAVEHVDKTLPKCYRELHYGKALGLELSANHSLVVSPEAQLPSWFKTSDGRAHVIVNDRVDFIVRHLDTGQVALVELKCGAFQPLTKKKATDQLLRYSLNYCQANPSAEAPLLLLVNFFSSTQKPAIVETVPQE